MRDALLGFIVVGLVVASFRSSVAALLGYLWFALMRPDILAWAVERPYSLVLGGVALLSAFRDIPWLGLALRSAWTWLFMGLSLWYALSLLTSQNIAASWSAFRFFLPTLLTALLIPVVIRTRENFRRMIIVIAVSLGVLGVKFGLWGLLRGGAQFISGYGGSVSDNNIFGLAMVTVLPLCWYGREAATDWRIRWGLTGMAFFVMAAAIQTHSRGSILSLGLLLPLMVWRSKRRIVALLLVVLLTAPTVYLVKDTLMARMNTLNVEATEDLDRSAQLRLHLWQAAWKMSLDYPVTGVGFGGIPYTEQLDKYMDGQFLILRYAHNNYLQILADSGFPALFLFCSLLFGQILWLGHLYGQLKGVDSELAAYAAGLQAALVGFAAGSTFLSRTYYELIYYLFMVVAAFGPLAQAALAARSRDQFRVPVMRGVPVLQLNRTPRPRTMP